MEKVIQLLGTLLVAYGFAYIVKRVLRAFKSQSSSLKLEPIEQPNQEVKLYRRGLPELPYRQYRNKTRAQSDLMQKKSEAENTADLTVFALISEHFDKAEEYAAIGYFEKAIEELNLALALEQGNTYIYEALGDLYMELVKHQDPVENLETAISCYRNALGLQPDGAMVNYKLGVALERRGFKAEAHEQLTKAQKAGLNRDDLDILIRQLDRMLPEDK